MEDYRIGLYYPHIEFQDDTWLKLAALYWDKLGRIMPLNYKPNDSRIVRMLTEELGFIKNFEPSSHDKKIVEKMFRELLYTYKDELVKYYRADLNVESMYETRKTRIKGKKLHRRLKKTFIRSGLAQLIKGSGTEEELAMHPKLAFLYLEVLAEQMAAVRHLYPVTDNIRDHVAVSVYPLDRLAQAVLKSGDGKPHLVDSSLRTYEIEVEAATMALQTVLPKNIAEVPIEKIIQLRKQHRDELTAFQSYHNKLVSDLESFQINDLEAIKAHLEIAYEKNLKPQLDDLKKCFNSLGMATVTGALNMRVALPPLLTSAGEYLAQAHINPANPLLAGGGALAFSVFSVIQKKQEETSKLVRSSPAAYLLYAQEELNPATLVSQVTQMARKMLFRV